MPHARVVPVRYEDRVAFSLAEISAMTGFSMSHLYNLIRSGRLKTGKAGGRRFATPQAIAELLGRTREAPAELMQPPAQLAVSRLADPDRKTPPG